MTSVFERMTIDEIVNFIQKNGLPAVQSLNPLPEDIDPLVDLIEKRFQIIQSPSQAAAEEDAAVDQKEAEAAGQQEQGQEKEIKGKLISDEDRAKLDAMESQMSKEAAEAMSEERRQQKEAWERIKNKGVIPIKFEGDQSNPPAINKRKVLFVCRDNSCLSQMAEAWCFKLFHDELDIASAGLNAAENLDDLAVATLLHHDMDICSWKTKGLEKVQELSFDVVCPMDAESQAVVEQMDWQGGQIVGGKFEVPNLVGRENLTPEEMEAMLKARRAFREMERRLEAGEIITMDALLEEPGLEERLAAMDDEDGGEAAIRSMDPKIRLVPDYRRLSAEMARFVESLPTVLAFMNQK